MTKAKSTRKPSKVQPVAQDETSGLVDQAVVDRLRTALAAAEEGHVDGVLIIIRTADGMKQVARAGWFKDHPEESLRSAIIGVMQGCQDDEQAARVEKPAEVVQWYH